MQGRQLISIDNVQVYHLLGGESHLLATGQLSVALVRAPLDASRPASPASFHTAASSPVDEKRKDGTASPRGLDVLILSLILPGDSEPLWEMATPPHSRIVSTPPSSYTIPNTTAGPASEDSGFIRVTLPAGLSAETRETFESILWCEASFSTTLEEAMTTQMTAPPPDYADPSLRSRLVLLNDSGDVVGTLSGNEHVVEDPSLSAEGQGSNEKEPVIIEQTVSSTGEADFTATPLSKLKWEPTPNPSGSGIITAADYLSRGIIVGAGYISRNMEAGASKWVTTRPSTTKPMEFTPTTKARLATANKYTGKAVVVTGKTAAVIADAAGRFGTKIGQSTGMNSNSDGKPPAGWRGVLNKSLIALNTVSDAVEAGGKTLMASGSTSASKVVGHSYGAEAESVARSFGTSVEHVALVYIDARGVTRRALIKAVGKSVIKAKMADGREVILTDTDGQQQQVQSDSSGLQTPTKGTSRSPSPVVTAGRSKMD